MPLVLTFTAVLGVATAWALTVPVHRYKELRPMTPRDVGSEVGSADSPPPVIRASYRQARCPSCHHVFAARDVTPVLSWFRGCPACGHRLAGTVALFQLGLPTAMVLTVALLGSTWIALPYVWFAVVLSVIAVIDLRIWLIPWWMPWAGAGVGLVLISAVSVGIGDAGQIGIAVIGALATFGVFLLLFLAAPGKLGFGDVRLALLLGLFLAWMHPILPVYGLLFGAIAGLVMGGAALLMTGESRFPFGPGLALGALVAVWAHQPILGTLG